MPRWIRRLFQKTRAESELDQELCFHLTRQIADYIASGMSPQEARRRAKLEFGGLERVKEEVRDTRWETHLQSLPRFPLRHSQSSQRPPFRFGRRFRSGSWHRRVHNRLQRRLQRLLPGASLQRFQSLRRI